MKSGIFGLRIASGCIMLALTVVCGIGASAAATGQYEVTWSSPGRDFRDSMPAGNGDLGVNLWTETIYANGSPVNATTFPMPTNLHNGFNLVEIVTTAPVSASSFNKDRICHAGDQYHAEVLIYDFSLTDEQRRQNEAYLKAKWFGETTSTNSPP